MEGVGRLKGLLTTVFVCFLFSLVAAEIGGDVGLREFERPLIQAEPQFGGSVSLPPRLEEYPVFDVASLEEVVGDRNQTRSPMGTTLTLAQLSRMGPSVQVDARTASESLELSFQGVFSPIRHLHVNRLATAAGAHSFGASALPYSSRLEIRHSNQTFGRFLVSPMAHASGSLTEVSYSTREATPLFWSGDTTEVVVDFSDHFGILEAIVLDTAESEHLGGDTLVVYSEGDDFARTELFLPSMESITIVLGPHDDRLLVRRLPSWFNAALTLAGTTGEDEIVVEEDLGDNVNGFTVDSHALTVRGSLSGTCPVTINTGSTHIQSTPCVCTGGDFISVTAAVISFTAGGTFETDAGDITLVATVSGLNGNLGQLTTVSGDIFITSTGIAIIPLLSFGGNVMITATADTTPIIFLNIDGTSASGISSFTAQANFVGTSGVRTGIQFLRNVNLVDYNAGFSTGMAGLAGAGLTGVRVDNLNWVQSTTTGSTSLTFSSAISGASTASSVGVLMVDTDFFLTDVGMIIDSDIAVTGIAIISVSLDTATITGVRSSVTIASQVNGDIWTGVLIDRGSITLTGSGDLSVTANVASATCPLGGCVTISLSSVVLDIVGDTELTTTGGIVTGAFDGVDVKFASMTGSTLNINGRGGGDSLASGIAVHITGASALSYSGAANILADCQDSAGLTMIGFVMEGSSLSVDNLDLLGIVGTKANPTVGGVGAIFDNAGLTFTGTSSSDIIGNGAGSTNFDGDQNMGILFLNSNFVNTVNAAIEFRGIGGVQSQASHGVRLATGTLTMSATGTGTIDVIGVAGGPIGGTQTLNNDGILLFAGMACDIGSCSFSGVCGSATTLCRGFATASGSISVGTSADLTISGNGEGGTDAPGVDLNSPLITLAANSVFNVVGQGGAGNGFGVSSSASFSSVGGGTKAVSITGTGGGSAGSTNSNFGVVFPFSTSFPADWDVVVTGRGGSGAGTDNVGVMIQDDLVGSDSISIIADGGSGSGSGNHGLVLVDDLSAVNAIDVTARALGNGPNNIGYLMSSGSAVTTAGAVTIFGQSGTGSSNVGCLVVGDIVGPGGLTLNCRSDGTGFSSHGLHFANDITATSLQGSPMSLTGTASLSATSTGVFVENGSGVILSDLTFAGIRLDGTGYRGVVIASDFVFGTASDVQINGAGSVGVDIVAAVSGANNLDIFGSGGGSGCASGCFGILQLEEVECLGRLTLDGDSGGDATSVGVRVGANLRSGVDIVVTGTGGIISASGLGLSNGSGNSGVYFEDGSWVLDDSTNTVEVAGTSSCGGTDCIGATISTGFGAVGCNAIGATCNFDLSGSSTLTSAVSSGVLVAGSHFFTETDIELNGSSVGSHGVHITGQLTTDLMGDITVRGTTIAVSSSGVRVDSPSGILPTDFGDLDITGTAPAAASLLDIHYSNGLSITSKLGGSVVYNSPLLVAGGGTVTGAIDFSILGGIEVSGGGFLVSSTGNTLWNGNSFIRSDTSIAGGGTVSLGTPSILLDNSQLTFAKNVFLTADVTIASVSGVCTFVGTTDGTRKLTLDGVGFYGFAASIGSLTPLDTLNLVDSTSTIRFQNSFATAEADNFAFAGNVDFNYAGVGAPLFTCTSFLSELSFADINTSSSSVIVAGTTVRAFGTVAVTFFDVQAGPPAASRSTVLDGDFSLTGFVSVQADHFAQLRGTFSIVLLQNTAVLACGSTGVPVGCFSATRITFSDFAAMQVGVGGDAMMPCIDYDQVSVSTTVSTVPGANALVVVPSGTVVRGETYFVLKDYTTLTNPFNNAPEGAAITVGSVVMFVTYLLDEGGVPGNDLALTANRLPDVMDDAYTIVGVTAFTEPAPGVLVNDNDPEGATLVASLVTAMTPSEGTVVLNSDGSFTYNSGGFLGVTTFVYQASDGFESAQATVTLTVMLASPTPTTTPTRTSTPSTTASSTSTRSPTTTSTSSTTSTETPTASSSPTNTPTKSATQTQTATPSSSQTATETKTPSTTMSATSSVTATQSETVTPSPSETASKSATMSPSMTVSGTASTTTSSSATASAPPTNSPSGTVTATPSQTSSASSTMSNTPSSSTTVSATPTTTAALSPGATPSETAASTRSATRTFTASKSPTKTVTQTATNTATPTRTPSPTKTTSRSLSSTKSASSTSSTTLSATTTPSITLAPSELATPSPTVSPTTTESAQATVSSTSSVTGTPSSSTSLSATASSSKSATTSATATHTPTGSASDTSSATVTPSSSRSPTSTSTASNTASMTATGSPSSTSSSTSTSSASESPSSTRSTSASPTSLLDLPSTSKTQTTTPSKDGAEIILPPNPAPSSSPSRTASVSASRSGSPSRLPGTSASTTPSPIAGGGLQPGTGGTLIPTDVTIFDGDESDRFVPIRDSDGRQIGSVTLPEESAGALVISSESDAIPIDAVVSAIVDITLVGPNGELITEFDDPLEICLQTDEDEDDICLGFYNEEAKWECEDYCLDASDGKVCGETDHLTSFALLLDTGGNGNERCGSESTDYVIVYLSIALISVSIVAVIVISILIEVRLRVKAYMLENTFRDIERGTTGLQTD